MRTFSYMDKHYDRHNQGICSICGCTTARWKSICDSCRNEDVQVEDQPSLKAEIGQLKKDKLELNAQCFHKDETISVLKNRITELEFDNRSLVEQMNQMEMRMEHKSGTSQRSKS